MTINVQAQSLKNNLDAAPPNALPDMFRTVKIGDILRAGPTFLRKKLPATSNVQLATLHSIVLADDGKAHNIMRAYARTATAGAGELTVVAYGATPASGQIAVAPNGDIVTLAADVILDLDVVYQPDKYDLVEATVAVATNVLTIPTAYTTRGAVLLLEAEATIGTSLGRKIVLVPGAGAPAAGQCRLNVAKTTVTFAGADAVTQARVKLAIVAATDVDALLTAVSNVA
jgi:hypothetical protein